MPRILTGRVVSDKPDKSIVVNISRQKTHPLYRKNYTVSRKMMAHDEKNEAHVGDIVAIVETRPHSAKKRFALARIIDKPSLSVDALSVAKVEDSGHKASKSKTVDDTPKEPAK